MLQRSVSSDIWYIWYWLLYTDTLWQIITWFLASKNVTLDTFSFGLLETVVFNFVSKYFRKAYKGFPFSGGEGGGVGGCKVPEVLTPDPTASSSWYSSDAQLSIHPKDASADAITFSSL